MSTRYYCDRCEARVLDAQDLTSVDFVKRAELHNYAYELCDNCIRGLQEFMRNVTQTKQT